MRKSTRRKLKVYAVDAAMILLAAQVTVVLKADNKAEASTYTTIQAIQDEQAETGSDAETPENDTKYNSASEDKLNWNNKDSDILLRIAMAEAEGEGTEGKALWLYGYDLQYFKNQRGISNRSHDSSPEVLLQCMPERKREQTSIFQLCRVC